MSQDFEVSFSKEKGFPYRSCDLIEVSLESHFEYPSDVKWSQLRLSDDGKYIGAKSSLTDGTLETLYIWSTENYKKHLYSYQFPKIISYGFASNSLSFVVFQQDRPPIHYNIKNGKKINELEINDVAIEKIIAFSFSTQGKYLAIGTDDHFFVWDILTSKMKINFIELSPVKFIQRNCIITIDDKCCLNLIAIQRNKKIKQFQLDKIKAPTDVLCSMLGEDLDQVYYATKDGLFLVSLSEGNCEQILSFENTNPEVVMIATDCKKVFTTDYINSFFWQVKKGKSGGFIRQKFLNILVSFPGNYIAVLDEYSISLQTFIDYAKRNDLCTIYFNKNPKEFYQVEYGMGVYILGRVNESEAVLYQGESGKILHKWCNKIPSFQRCLKMSPQNAEVNLLCTKTSSTLIQVWDYTTSVAIIDILDFDAYELQFSADGMFLVGGATKGPECAKIWDLDDIEHPYTFIDNQENNKNICVYLTNDRMKLICIPQKQSPIIFDAETQKVIKKLKTSIVLDEIIKVYTNWSSSVIICYGKYSKDKVCCALEIKTGNCIKVINNCEYTEISEDKTQFITLAQQKKVNSITLGIWDLYKNFTNQQNITNITDDYVRILNDSKLLVMFDRVDRRNLRFRLCKISDGEMIGELNYNKSHEYYVYLDVVIEGKNIVLRRIAFKDDIKSNKA